MYLDPAVVRRALEASGEGADAVQRLLAAAAGDEFSAAIGAPGLVELIDWAPAGGDGPGGRPAGEGAAPGLAAARVAARTLRVLPLTAYEVFLAADLVRTYPGLPSRAALHVAIMLNNGELEVVSDDTVFDQVSEIRRIPPARLGRALARRRPSGGGGGADAAGGRAAGAAGEGRGPASQPGSAPAGVSASPVPSGGEATGGEARAVTRSTEAGGA